MNTKRIEASNSWDRFDESFERRRQGQQRLIKIMIPAILIVGVVGMIGGIIIARMLLEVIKCH